MNSDLVRSTCLQRTFNHRVFADPFDGLNMGYCSLRTFVLRTICGLGSSLAIATIAYENTVNRLSLGMSVNDCVVFSDNLMFAKRVGFISSTNAPPRVESTTPIRSLTVRMPSAAISLVAASHFWVHSARKPVPTGDSSFKISWNR